MSTWLPESNSLCITNFSFRLAFLLFLESLRNWAFLFLGESWSNWAELLGSCLYAFFPDMVDTTFLTGRHLFSVDLETWKLAQLVPVLEDAFSQISRLSSLDNQIEFVICDVSAGMRSKHTFLDEHKRYLARNLVPARPLGRITT
jgi:hypothetical protein